MSKEKWEPFEADDNSTHEKNEKDEDEEQDNQNRFVPMKGEKAKRKKIDRIIEERSNKGRFTAFNDFGMPINKIEKEILPFEVIQNYFEKLEKNQPGRAIDVNSKNRIWGLLLASLCEKTEVSLLVDRQDRDTAEGAAKIIEANGISNADAIDQEELNKLEQNNTLFDLAVFEHMWGVNSTSAYNEISKIWLLLETNGNLIVVSHKKRGADSLLKFFQDRGIESEIASRGRGGVRLIRLTKASKEVLEPIETKRRIQFEYNGKPYDANVDNAVFSSEGLDEGTRFLLDTVKKNEGDFNKKTIGDLGAGWGAISMVIAREFPEVNLSAFEKDPAAYNILQENLSNLSGAKTFKTDLTDKESKDVKSQSEQLDYIISNPPFHVSEQERKNIFMNAKKLLKNGGVLIFVVEKSFADRFRETARQFFSLDDEFEGEKYNVIRCRK